MKRTTGLGLALMILVTAGSELRAAAPPTNSVSAATPQARPEPGHGTSPGAADADGSAEATPPTPAKPYDPIVARNAFGIKTPPPPPPPPEPQVQVTPSALKLTGVTTLLSGKRAMFVLQEPGKAVINSDLVREGERDTYITNLEVVTIDERAGLVRVIYGGKEMSLNFADNGIKPPVGPAVLSPAQNIPGRPPPVPGVVIPAVPPAPGQGPGVGAVPAVQAMNQPGAQLGNVTFNADNASGLRSIPARPTRLPVGGGGAYGSAQGYVAGGGPGGIAPQAQPVQPALSPEQQMLMMKAQELHAQQQGLSLPPPLPIQGLDTGPPAIPVQSQPTVPGPPGFPGAPPGFPPGRGN